MLLTALNSKISLPLHQYHRNTVSIQHCGSSSHSRLLARLTTHRCLSVDICILLSFLSSSSLGQAFQSYFANKSITTICILSVLSNLHQQNMPVSFSASTNQNKLTTMLFLILRTYEHELCFVIKIEWSSSNSLE